MFFYQPIYQKEQSCWSFTLGILHLVASAPRESIIKTRDGFKGFENKKKLFTPVLEACIESAVTMEFEAVSF